MAMQTTCNVLLELQPASVTQVRARIAAMEQQQKQLAIAYSAIKAAIPQLHFMSVTIFPDDVYDPILVIEVNFDGPPGPFWTLFEHAFNEDLRAILRCGKVPRDGRGGLFTAVTRPFSRVPIAPLLEALTVAPSVAHQGNRGLDRGRIETEGQLFAEAQRVLDTGIVAPGASASQVHQALRTTLSSAFDLGQAAAPRISRGQSLADYAELAGFVCLAVFAALVPGMLLSLVVPRAAAAALLLAAGAIMAARLDLPKGAAPGPRMVEALALAGVALLVFGLGVTAAIAVLASMHHWRPEHFGARFAAVLPHVALGVLGLFPTLAGLLLWVRALERRDPPQDAPPRDETMLRAMARREDQITQNHMGSVVHLKPGILRAAVVRVALHALGLVLRVVARNGFLGSMRTIHFAHWSIVSNGGRLMFFSNFDGSWESYLDDFIEKAHGGLTLAWTSGVGFPPTRFLVLDGATQGRAFKAWARHSMAESLFWYSAYIGFTVNQIERQARLADGLRRPVLDEREASAWAMDL